MVMEGDLARGGEHTVQYTDEVLLSRAPETYIIILTDVTLINSIKSKNINKIKYQPKYFI